MKPVPVPSSTRQDEFSHLPVQRITPTHISCGGIAKTASRSEWDYSHSIVPGGLLVTSYTTLFTPFTSLMMRVAVSPKNFMSNW